MLANRIHCFTVYGLLLTINNPVIGLGLLMKCLPEHYLIHFPILIPPILMVLTSCNPFSSKGTEKPKD